MELNKYGEVIGAEVGVCPYCGGTDLDYGAFELFGSDMGYYPVTCNDCHASFEETYTMKFSSQDNVDISKCNT